MLEAGKKAFKAKYSDQASGQKQCVKLCLEFSFYCGAFLLVQSALAVGGFSIVHHRPQESKIAQVDEGLRQTC